MNFPLEINNVQFYSNLFYSVLFYAINQANFYTLDLYISGSILWTSKPADNELLQQRNWPSAMPRVPASLPLAIMLVATSLIVDCEGPEEVMVVTRQALSESQ